MKEKLLFVLLIAFSVAFVQSDQPQYRSVKAALFPRGEKLVYLVHYAFVNAGEAVVQLDKDFHKVNDRVCYKVDITGKSIGAVSFMFKINDLWRSYIDTGAVIPQKFQREIQENDYRKSETVIFNHFKKTARLTHKTNADPEITKDHAVPTYAQDMVSGYYFLRTLDFSQIKAGDTIKIDGFLDGENYNFKIKYLGKERLQTNFGKIHTAIISPIMPETQLFAGTNPIKCWISDDGNRVPLKIQAELKVGAVELDLIDFKGLKHKFRK